MARICSLCTDPANVEYIVCNGGCDSTFHISCLAKENKAYTKKLCGQLQSIQNLWWYCSQCMESSPLQLLENCAKVIGEFQQNIVPLLERVAKVDFTVMRIDNGSSHPAGSVPESQHQIGTVASGDNDKADMDTFDANDNVSNQSFITTLGEPSLTDPPNRNSLHPNVSSRKRPNSTRLSSEPLSKQQKVTDTPPSLADFVVKPKERKSVEQNITVKTNLTRSIYITPFHPSCQTSNIIDHLKSNSDLEHIVPNIVCTRLAGNRKDLDFVSFKLDVPRHHYDIVTDPAIWQFKGEDKITIEEFISKRDRKNKSGTDGNKINNSSNNNNKKGNPFTAPPQNQRSCRLSERGGGAKNQQHKQGVNHNKGKANQLRGQNFPQGCQKQCCSRPRPRLTCCHDHYGENRFDRRQRNRC